MIWFFRSFISLFRGNDSRLGGELSFSTELLDISSVEVQMSSRGGVSEVLRVRSAWCWERGKERL